MLRRSTLVAAALSTALAATACRDSLAPLHPHTAAKSLASVAKSGQCIALESTVATALVAPGVNEPAPIAAPLGEVVNTVAAQAGSACWLTPEGATGSYTIVVEGAPCYVVAGLGTGTVTLTRVGTAPTCKNVTHVEYTTTPAARTGYLQLCKAIQDAWRGYLTEPFIYAVAGTVVTAPVGESGTTSPPLSCAEPLKLAAGTYFVAEQPNVSALPVIDIATAPADLLLSADFGAKTAMVVVVGGTTTVLTFTGWWPPEPTS